jgi:signal peptidase I
VRARRDTVVKHAKDALQVFLAALAGALVLKLLVLDAVYVPSGSMEGTLLRGDYVFVNKLLYGARVPGRLPILRSSLPFFQLPGLSSLRRGDVVVFDLPAGAFPDARHERVTFVKRCVGLPGDEVEIVRGAVRVNGEELRPGGWSADRSVNFGPVRVPGAGDVLALTPATSGRWERLIMSEGHRVERADGMVLVDGAPRDSYTVEADHVFVLGDNINHSYDSRMWGFLPRENIVGNAMMVYWSVDPSEDRSAIRWDRVGAVIR